MLHWWEVEHNVVVVVRVVVHADHQERADGGVVVQDRYLLRVALVEALITRDQEIRNVQDRVVALDEMMSVGTEPEPSKRTPKYLDEGDKMKNQ